MSEQTIPTRRRATFHRLTVSEVRRLTKDSIEVSFAIPEELSTDFDYVAGQYVALRKELPNAEGDLVEVRRSYSICAAPTGEQIKVAIKKDLGGQFSTWANEELVAGDQIDVMSPTGAFISKHKLTGMNDPSTVDTVNQDQFVAVAAGSGITPVLAIARTILEANENTRFDLIYANKAAMDVMFLEELADLKDRYPARLALHHVLSREQRISPLLSGRIDAEKLSALLNNVLQAPKVDEWFLCGPFELVQMVRDQLKELEVPNDKVRFELFTTGEPNRPQGQVGRPVLVDENEKSFEITFTLDGLQGEVKSPVRANETVLNAALRVRPDVPFACAGGVCGTCRAKVTAGSVTMSENYALEPEELEAGYVLTCQSHPTSDKLSVNFDS